MTLARSGDGSDDDLARHLCLSERALKYVREILSIRVQFLKGITYHGIDIALQMIFLV